MPTAIKGRISESELVVPALRAASERPNGYIQTSELIIELEERLRPEGEDAEIATNRTDTKFSQKVRNLVSHREQDNSMFSLGYAIYTGDGIQITDAGQRYLEKYS